MAVPQPRIRFRAHLAAALRGAASASSGSGPFVPELHVHLAVHRGRADEMLAGLLALSRTLVERAESKVAVCNERAHPARIGKPQGLLVVRFPVHEIECVRMGSDLGAQV